MRTEPHGCCDIGGTGFFLLGGFHCWVSVLWSPAPYQGSSPPFVLTPDLHSHNGPQGQSTVELVLPCSEPQPHDSGLLVML